MLPRARPWQNTAVFLIVLAYFYNLASSQSSGSGSRRLSPCDQWDACSQICVTPNGLNVTCSCVQGFSLGDNNRSCIPNDPTIQIAYALKSSVKMSNVNRTTGTFFIAENKGQTIGVTVDVAGGYVYWTDVSEGKEAVHRSKANGEGPIETVVDTGLLLPEGIAFDWVTGNIYIADSNRSHIVVCRRDGKMCTVLVRQLMMDKPREVALHPGQGLMFWTDWGEKSSIMRAYMDGTSSISIIAEDIKWPNSLAVDYGRNRLYWTDAYHDKIETSTLTGSDRQLVNMDNVNHPFSLEVFGDLIFWSDWELRRIQSCTKFACKSDIRTVLEFPVKPNGLAIFHTAAQPQVRSNSCQNQCSHICVLYGKTGYSCKCPVGFKLDRSKKQCIDDESKPKLLIGHDNFVKVFRFDSIGRDVDIIENFNIPTLKNVGAMIYNAINDTMFISDLTRKAIYEYSFASGVFTHVIDRHVDSVKSMSLDQVGENLYWIDSSRRKVEVMSCRSGARALIAMEADHPQSIIVVPEERYLFVALTGRRGGRILRMNMNGFNRRTLVRTNRGEPISLTYNAELKRIFWIDSTRDSIEHVSLNGRSQATAERAGTPYGLTSFGNRIFWTDRHTQLLHTTAVFGVDAKDSPVFIGHLDDKYTNGTVESYIKGNFLASLTIMYKDSNAHENLTTHHECSTSKRIKKCSHICLFSAELDVGTCVCPEGMHLTADNRTCGWAPSCLKSQFQCNDKRCIDSDWVCDGFPDCETGEDELRCQTKNTCTGETEFMCESDKSCIHSNWKCDGQRDCPNGEDEFNCGSNTCSPDTEFQCNNGRCIPAAWRCDDQFECPDGEDEIGCNRTCPIGTFQCKKDLECISVDWVCDGEADCSDSSDEDGHCEVISPEESPATSEASSLGSSSAGWWVFGIFLILFLVGGIVGFIFHQKRLHPKVLFERYAHHIPVKFNIRRNAGPGGAAPGDEETYQDFSDGRSSSDHAGLLSNMDGDASI